jgi:hypothetical protein
MLLSGKWHRHVPESMCFPPFVSKVGLHFYALMSVNNKYYALQIFVAFYVVISGLEFISDTGQLGTGLC